MIPERFSSLLKNADEVQERWDKKEKIGGGCNGCIYRACKDKSSRDCAYVIKVQPFNGQAKAELRAYHSLQGSGLTPRLHAAWRRGRNMYMVIDRLVPCKPQLRRKEVFALLDKLERRGWVHVDTHDGNIMCTESRRGNQKPVLIDFGWSVHRDDAPFRRHPAGERSFDKLRDVQRENVLDCFR